MQAQVPHSIQSICKISSPTSVREEMPLAAGCFGDARSISLSIGFNRMGCLKRHVSWNGCVLAHVAPRGCGYYS